MNKMVVIISKIAHFPVDIVSNRSYEEKICLLSAATILGTCWGLGKIYFWRLRQKTKQAIADERKLLKERKEELLRQLTNDKVLLAQMACSKPSD